MGGGGQGGCEQRIEVFGKIQKQIYLLIFFFLGGGGSGGGSGRGGSDREGSGRM